MRATEHRIQVKSLWSNLSANKNDKKKEQIKSLWENA